MSDLYRTCTIADLIGAGGDDAPAIGAPGLQSLSHGGLRRLVPNADCGARPERAWALKPQ